jgi:hypothetical protein
MSCDFSQMARSHQLTMQTVQQNSPDVPGLLYRLSASNFYLYFAHQCSSRGNDRQALNWLLKALQAECVTPLIRPGFYRLLLKSGLGLIRRSSTQPSQSLQPSQGKYSQQFDPSQYQPDVLFRDPKIWADRMLYQIMTLGTLYLTKILQLYRLAFKQ